MCPGDTKRAGGRRTCCNRVVDLLPLRLRVSTGQVSARTCVTVDFIHRDWRNKGQKQHVRSSDSLKLYVCFFYVCLHVFICLSVCLSFFLPACLPVLLSVCMYVLLYVCPSMSLSFYLSACQFFFPSLCPLSVCQLSFCQPACLPAFLSACLSTCISVSLSDYLYFCQPNLMLSIKMC